MSAPRRVLAMGEAEERRSFHLGWLQWRRAHQAVSARSHAARRARRLRGMRPGGLMPIPVQVPVPGALERAAVAPAGVGRPLTDAQWQHIFPLLPPQRPPIGRPRHERRTVLNGILSVLLSGASWREMPQEYGKWETAYRRYRLWQDEGRWPRILETLNLPAARPPP